MIYKFNLYIIYLRNSWETFGKLWGNLGEILGKLQADFLQMSCIYIIIMT
jgi:hypothetical protein